MEDKQASVDPEIAELQRELAMLKQAIAQAADEGLPLVEMLLKDNARRIEAEQKLSDARRWMEFAQETGGVASYYMDIRAGRLWWSHSVYRLYGMNPAVGEPSVDLWLSTIHPDDRERVAKVAQDAIERGMPVSHQFRIILPCEDSSGERVRWIYDRGTVELDDAGAPVRLHGVNIDLTDVRRAEVALRDSERQFRQTFEHANVGVAHVSMEGKFLRVNDALCSILQRSPDELESSSFQETTHPADLDADLDKLHSLVAGEVNSYSMEKRYLLPDGSHKWCDLSVSLLRDHSGVPLHFISIVSDIDERKRAHEQVELILGESNHRVKNLLAVLGVIVSASAKSTGSVSELRDLLSSRLMGISASHDLLMGKYLEGAELEHLVVRQMDIFTDRSLGRIAVRGDLVHLSPSAVHAFGMVLHELATNACKYGALSNDAGRVAIEWDVDQATGTLAFRWSELGGPIVVHSGHKGFGTKTLERMLAGALGGTARHSLPADGALFEATIPLRMIEARR